MTEITRRGGLGLRWPRRPWCTAFCTFSKARTSIWRMRSRLTPNSADSSSSVSGSSASRRASNTRRSRSFKPFERVVQHAAALVALLGLGERRLLVHGVVDQPVLPLAALGVVAHRGVEREVAGKPPVHRDHVLLGHAELVAISFTWSGLRSPSSSALSWPLILRRLKNSFFCAAVVPIFTRLHERRMYSWIAALIHHMA